MASPCIFSSLSALCSPFPALLLWHQTCPTLDKRQKTTLRGSWLCWKIYRLPGNIVHSAERHVALQRSYWEKIATHMNLGPGVFPGWLKWGESSSWARTSDVDIVSRSKKQKNGWEFGKGIQDKPNSAEPKKEKSKVRYGMWIWGIFGSFFCAGRPKYFCN